MYKYRAYERSQAENIQWSYLLHLLNILALLYVLGKKTKTYFSYNMAP